MGRRERDRLAKNNVAKSAERERSIAGWQSWSEVRASAQDKSRWRVNVEA